MGYRSIWGCILFLFRYLAYKFLGTIWVNMLLTLYLTGVGLLALGETIFAVTVSSNKQRRYYTACVPLLPSWPVPLNQRHPANIGDKIMGQ